MKKRGMVTVLVLLVIWHVAAELVDNPIIFPSLQEVVEKMGELAASPVFYEAFAYTLMRAAFGLVLAMALAIVFGVISGLNRHVEEYVEPIYIILKSIPNISYILIVLIWTNSRIATCVISFMVMFPMAYANVLAGMKSIESKYVNLMKIYPTTLRYKIFRIDLPLISSYLSASLSNGIGLTFKVGIMAEILGSVSPGMGRQFQLCRLNVDMVGTFAWTIWLILFLMGLETLVKFVKKR